MAWTVKTQTQLDRALREHPKLEGEDSKARWAKIANMVEGRSMKECVERYRELRAKFQESHKLKAPGIAAQAAELPPPPPPPLAKHSAGVRVGYAPPTSPAGLSPPDLEPGGARARYLAFQRHEAGTAIDREAYAGCGSGRVGERSDELGSGSGRSGGWGVRVLDHDDVISAGVGWWASLDEEDPISLEPLRELPYPPFEVNGAGNGEALGVRSRTRFRAAGF